MRIVAFERALREVGTTLTVVVLPYEMQISTDAESTYRSLGVRWEDGFIDRGPQRLLFEYLPPDIRVIDAYYAFSDGDNAAA
jgi:hypothetical protein